MSLISRLDCDITIASRGEAANFHPGPNSNHTKVSEMARATNDDSTTVPIVSFVLIDLALFFAAGVLGSFAIACIV